MATPIVHDAAELEQREREQQQAERPVPVLYQERRQLATRQVLDFPRIMGMAEVLVKTGFLPKAIKTSAQAAAVILSGQELGLPPMYALRVVHIVDGKPTLAAELQLGLFRKAGGRYRWLESDDKRAVIWLRHPSGDEHTETFTWDDAVRGKITGRDNWKNYPKNMLRARCASGGLRAIAPDIIGNLYDPDELGAIYDGIDAANVQVPEALQPQAGAIASAAASASGGATARSAQEEDVGKRVREGIAAIESGRFSIEDARAFPLPWTKSETYGQPIGTFSREHLEGIVSWCEKEDRMESPRNAALHMAASMILDDLDRQQGRLPLDGAPADGGATTPNGTPASSTDSSASTATEAPAESGSVKVPPPGAVADAVAPDPESVAGLHQRIDRALASQGITDDERADARRRKLNDPSSAPKLKKLAESLESLIKRRAPAPRTNATDADDGLPF